MKTRASCFDQTSIFFQVIIDQAALWWVSNQRMADVGPVWSLISQATQFQWNMRSEQQRFKLFSSPPTKKKKKNAAWKNVLMFFEVWLI